MEPPESMGTCPECTIALLDAGDEMVCPSCGMVGGKEVTETLRGRAPVASDFTPQALGSYLGSADATGREHYRGLSGSPSTYSYLKTVSDFAGRDDGTLFECARMVERVCERLSLPSVVMGRAVIIARRMLGSRHGRRRTTIAAVSAFAIIASARMWGAGTVSTKEVIDAHRALGRTLRVSSIIQLSLESHIRIEPKSPVDYLPRVLARLSAKASQGKATTPLGQAGHLEELRRLAKEILEGISEDSKAGHRPFALAATAVYAAEVVLSTQQGRARSLTQREAAECGDTAEYTVREQYREIVAPAIPRLGLRQTPPAPIAR